MPLFGHCVSVQAVANAPAIKNTCTGVKALSWQLTTKYTGYGIKKPLLLGSVVTDLDLLSSRTESFV
jgi:hypothetical protein